VARAAIARLDDVDKDSIDLEKANEGRLTFRARKGRSLDLARIHAALKETRLSGKPPGNTRARCLYLEITARGTVLVQGGETLLKVPGKERPFVLAETPEELVPRGAGTTPFLQLLAALGRGEKVISVTGRVQGWSGHFPAVLKELPGTVKDPANPNKPAVPKPLVLAVTDFELARK
jgi:hypothetical protein